MSNEREPREESEQKSSELAMVCVGLSKRQQRWWRARPDGRTDPEVRGGYNEEIRFGIPRSFHDVSPASGVQATRRKIEEYLKGHARLYSVHSFPFKGLYNYSTRSTCQWALRLSCPAASAAAAAIRQGQAPV